MKNLSLLIVFVMYTSFACNKAAEHKDSDKNSSDANLVNYPATSQIRCKPIEINPSNGDRPGDKKYRIAVYPLTESTREYSPEHFEAWRDGIQITSADKSFTLESPVRHYYIFKVRSGSFEAGCDMVKDDAAEKNLRPACYLNTTTNVVSRAGESLPINIFTFGTIKRMVFDGKNIPLNAQTTKLPNTQSVDFRVDRARSVKLEIFDDKGDKNFCEVPFTIGNTGYLPTTGSGVIYDNSNCRIRSKEIEAAKNSPESARHYIYQGQELQFNVETTAKKILRFNGHPLINHTPDRPIVMKVYEPKIIEAVIQTGENDESTCGIEVNPFPVKQSFCEVILEQATAKAGYFTYFKIKQYNSTTRLTVNKGERISTTENDITAPIRVLTHDYRYRIPKEEDQDITITATVPGHSPTSCSATFEVTEFEEESAIETE